MVERFGSEVSVGFKDIRARFDPRRLSQKIDARVFNALFGR
jgi:hypothetical protein